MCILLNQLFNQYSSFFLYSNASVAERTSERSYYVIIVRRIKVKLSSHVAGACLEHHQTSVMELFTIIVNPFHATGLF